MNRSLRSRAVPIFIAAMPALAIPSAHTLASHAPDHSGLRPHVISDTGYCTSNGQWIPGGLKLSIDANVPLSSFCDRYIGDSGSSGTDVYDVRGHAWPGVGFCGYTCDEGGSASSVGTQGSTGSGTISSPATYTRLHFPSGAITNFPSLWNDNMSYICANVAGQTTCAS